MSHCGDIRQRVIKLCAQLRGQRLAGGTAVDEVIIKIEPDAELGANIRDKGREGHELAHGTDEEKLQRWGEYQIEMDRLHELNSTLSYEDMAKSAARKFGVCIKTIKRHTNNPRKK